MSTTATAAAITTMSKNHPSIMATSAVSAYESCCAPEGEGMSGRGPGHGEHGRCAAPVGSPRLTPFFLIEGRSV